MEFLITMGAMTVFFCVLTIWAQRADKKDKERRARHQAEQ